MTHRHLVPVARGTPRFVKLLLDENLSPAVALALKKQGLDVVHIRDRGMLGTTDPEVFDKAFAEDRILVTLNVGDFVKLASARELHAGVVLIEQPGLTRDEQLAVIQNAIKFIGNEDMANRVVWVNDDGTMEFEDIPKP